MNKKNPHIIHLHNELDNKKYQRYFLQQALDETVSLRIEIANIYDVLETLCASDNELRAFLKITDRLEKSSLRLNIIFKALEKIQNQIKEKT